MCTVDWVAPHRTARPINRHRIVKGAILLYRDNSTTPSVTSSYCIASRLKTKVKSIIFLFFFKCEFRKRFCRIVSGLIDESFIFRRSSHFRDLTTDYSSFMHHYYNRRKDALVLFLFLVRMDDHVSSCWWSVSLPEFGSYSINLVTFIVHVGGIFILTLIDMFVWPIIFSDWE